MINVSDFGGTKESVCYEDEINNIETAPSTARKYKGVLNGVEQGVNQSYTCQNYLIVRRGENFNQLVSRCSPALDSLNISSLPNKEVVRTHFPDGTNKVSGLNSAFCNNLTEKSYKLTITITNATTDTDVYTDDLSGKKKCTLSDTPATYICEGQTRGNVFSVMAEIPDQKMGICSIELNKDAEGACTITLVDLPTYTLHGSIQCKSGNTYGTCPTTGQTTTVYVSDKSGELGSPCTPNPINSQTFTCEIKTIAPVVDITANRGNKSDFCSVIGLTADPGATETKDDVCVLKVD
ncbi:MAG: hypothetical protein IBX56_18515 [Methylomicrobium sp.]|nr:hypothetical protein [Methylomicrobium sp.]